MIKDSLRFLSEEEKKHCEKIRSFLEKEEPNEYDSEYDSEEFCKKLCKARGLYFNHAAYIKPLGYGAESIEKFISYFERWPKDAIILKNIILQASLFMPVFKYFHPKSEKREIDSWERGAKLAWDFYEQIKDKYETSDRIAAEK
jgi:rubrerythrin